MYDLRTCMDIFRNVSTILSPPETCKVLINARLPFMDVAFGINGIWDFRWFSYDFTWFFILFFHLNLYCFQIYIYGLNVLLYIFSTILILIIIWFLMWALSFFNVGLNVFQCRDFYDYERRSYYATNVGLMMLRMSQL